MTSGLMPGGRVVAMQEYRVPWAVNPPERGRMGWFFAQLSPAVSAVAIVVGILVLLGWTFDLVVLKSVIPGLPSMKVNGALGFILAGVALWNACSGMQRRLSRIVSLICALGVVLIGLLTLGEYLSGRDLGIDQLLVRDISNIPGEIPGRIAARTAFSFVVLGAAILLINWNRRSLAWVVQALAVVVTLVAGVALVGYAYDFEGLLQVRLIYSPMALYTAATLVLLAIGVACACPDYPLVQIMTSDSVAGGVARRLFPVAVGFPFVSGWVISKSYQAGYFNEAAGLALFAVANIGGLGVVALWNVAMLHTVDVRRRRAEESVRRSEAELKEAQRVAGVGSWDLDPGTGTILWSEEIHRIFGHDPAQPAPDYDELRQLLTADSFARMNAAIEITRKTGEPFGLDLELRRPDGATRWITARGEVRRDDWGRIIGLRGTALDITERKQAEEEVYRLNAELEQRVIERTAQLEAAVKDLESFSYSVSHDLRAPLRAIDGFSRILLEEYSARLDDEGRRLLNVVRNNTAKMSWLIDDILMFSRAGQHELALVEVDMEALARSAWEELAPVIDARNVRFEAGALPRACGDRSALTQVLANLLANAAKFTRPRDTALVEVGGSAVEGENVYYVRDNGAGFDMQYAHKLFGVFQRLHSTSEFEGTGIGLAIVKRIVDKHGGRVWAEGKVNEGACFFFALPRREPCEGDKP